jgi:O-antigen/teichoic acid export membrane protein
VTTMLVTLIGLSAAAGAIVAASTLVLPWEQVLGAPLELVSRREVRLSVALAAGLTAAGMVAGITAAIYSAYQEVHWTNIWEALTRLGLLGAALAVSATELGVAGVVAALIGGPLVVRVASFVHLFGLRKPWLRPRRGAVHMKLARGMFAEGSQFFVLQLAWVVLYQADILIIAAFIGVRDVATYAVVSQLALMAYSLFWMVLSPQWPAYGEAIRRGEWTWIDRSHRRTLMAGAAISGVFALVMAAGGSQLVDFWTRGSITTIPTALALGISASLLLRMWVDARSTILNSAGVLRPQMVFYGGHAAAALALSVVVATLTDTGAAGVAWANVAAGLATSAWGYVWLLRQFRAEQIRSAGLHVAD